MSGIKSDFEKAFNEEYGRFPVYIERWAFLQGMKKAAEIADKHKHTTHNVDQDCWYLIRDEILSAIKEFSNE